MMKTNEIQNLLPFSKQAQIVKISVISATYKEH